MKQSHGRLIVPVQGSKQPVFVDKDPQICRSIMGRMIMANLGGDETTLCSIANLRRVDGTSLWYDFCWKSRSGSVAAIDTFKTGTFVNKLLDISYGKCPAEADQGECNCFHHPLCICVPRDDWGVIVNGTHCAEAALHAKAKRGRICRKSRGERSLARRISRKRIRADTDRSSSR